MRILFLFISVLWISGSSIAQTNRQLQALRIYLQFGYPPGYDSTAGEITYRRGADLDYMLPLFQLIKNETKFRTILGQSGYYNAMAEAVSFMEDYESVLEYQKKAYDTAALGQAQLRQIAKTMQALKGIQHADARKFISFAARNVQVIMLNEAHDKPLHRAFAISLLDDLKKRGFRYLALEMLNNFPNQELNKLTPLTGTYTAEPLAGELVRTALDMGFKLVAYEDTAAYRHSATERDSVQARNIYAVIQADSTARIFVLGGYAHIGEKSLSAGYIPMGMAFKKISGIDPLTIDQVDMTEESDFAFGKAFYDAYTQKFPVSGSSIALIDDQPVNVTNNELYDLTVIHPRTFYTDGRPTWLNLDGRRQPIYIKPSKTAPFLVQAYYQFETLTARPGQLIPADQTYIPASRGNYLFYLKKGKYIVVFRDMSYRIISTQQIEVN